MTPSLLPSFSTVYGTRPLLRFTSVSSQRRPMKRLIEYTVLAGFVTAWRLASWPTRRSPVFVNATTDGTVRPPSADEMTVGSPPSITATTEFVVPRSMPMILPMSVVAPCLAESCGWCRYVVRVMSVCGAGELGSGRGVGRGGRHGDKGRADDT